MKKVRWVDMTPEEFIDARKERPVAYMPFGHAEAHGVYNPLGVDWYSADMMCETIAKRYKGIVCPGLMFHVDEEPYMNWGINSCKMGEQFCSGISNSLFLHNLLYQIRLLDARKFKAALLIGGHAVPGLRKDAQLLIEYYKMKTGSPLQIDYLVYLDLDRQARKRLFPNQIMVDGHAGFTETALIMALKPEIAHPELIGTSPRYPESGGGREGKFGAQLMVPLSVGIIGKVEGLDDAKKEHCVSDFLQYYYLGDEIKQNMIRTLKQHFGRFTFISESEEELRKTVCRILDILKIYDTNGNLMNTLKFDYSRTEKSQIN